MNITKYSSMKMIDKNILIFNPKTHFSIIKIIRMIYIFLCNIVHNL